MKNETKIETTEQETTDAAQPAAKKTRSKKGKVGKAPEGLGNAGADTSSATGAVSEKETPDAEQLATDSGNAATEPDAGNKNVIYRVEKESGIVTESDIATAIATIPYSEDVVRKAMTDGKVLGSTEVYFSANRTKLKKFEKAQERPLDTPPVPDTTPSEGDKREEDPQVPEPPKTPSEDAGSAGNDKPEPHYELDAPEGVPFEIGDKVINGTGQIGIVVNKNNQLQVSFEINGAPKSQKLDAKNITNWRLLSPEETETEKAKTALAKKDADAIQGEVVLPLTEEEKAELAEREQTVLDAKEKRESAIQTIERTENVMAENIAVIRQNGLWRESKNKAGETCASFKEYAIDVLGFDDKYAQNLAQIGSYRIIAKELTDESLDVSVNANNALLRGTRKIVEGLGLGTMEFNEVKPIIKAGLAVLGELAKDEKTGEIDFDTISPRLITEASETMLDMVKTNTVELDGKQMTVEQAKAKGVLDTAFREQVVTKAAEGILVKKEIIKQETLERRQANHTPPETPPKSNGTQVWEGAPSSFRGGCETHKKPIKAIYNGSFQTACEEGCRFRISTTGKIECYEISGKQVKHN